MISLVGKHIRLRNATWEIFGNECCNDIANMTPLLPVRDVSINVLMLDWVPPQELQALVSCLEENMNEHSFAFWHGLCDHIRVDTGVLGYLQTMEEMWSDADRKFYIHPYETYVNPVKRYDGERKSCRVDSNDKHAPLYGVFRTEEFTNGMRGMIILVPLSCTRNDHGTVLFFEASGECVHGVWTVAPNDCGEFVVRTTFQSRRDLSFQMRWNAEKCAFDLLYVDIDYETLYERQTECFIEIADMHVPSYSEILDTAEANKLEFYKMSDRVDCKLEINEGGDGFVYVKQKFRRRLHTTLCKENSAEIISVEADTDGSSVPTWLQVAKKQTTDTTSSVTSTELGLGDDKVDTKSARRSTYEKKERGRRMSAILKKQNNLSQSRKKQKGGNENSDKKKKRNWRKTGRSRNHFAYN